MQNVLVFKTGLAKRTMGWCVSLGALGALVATIYAICTHPEAQVSSELWFGVVIGVFLIGLMVTGIALQYVRWSIEGDNIIYHRLFTKKTIPLAGLEGFGKLIVIVVAIPFAHLDLFDGTLRHIARLPVSFNDWPTVEAWCAERLRYVVNDGSAALPKRRFADTPKS